MDADDKDEEDDDGEDYEAEIFGALKMYTTYELFGGTYTTDGVPNSRRGCHINL